VKINYGISFEEFRTLQPPYERRLGSIGLALIMGFICLLLLVPGVGVVVRDLSDGEHPPPMALVPIALSLLLCCCAYLLDRRSLLRQRASREQELLAAYKRVHCRNSRSLEATSEALALSCDCGLLARPWSDLTGFTETPAFLIPLMRSESVPIPKSAFASEGDLTEFRRLVLDKLHTDRPFNACPIEFAHTRADFWRAKLLHVRKGGGWRRVLKLGIPAAALICVVLASALAAYRGQAPAWITPVAFGGLAFFLTLTVRPQQRYYGPLQIFFSEEGFHVVDPASQSRRRWSELAGYLEDRHVYLLYLNPRLYRIIPRRALSHRNGEFDRLIQAALPQFDYRRRFPIAGTARASD
jgi:hypothetical protein